MNSIKLFSEKYLDLAIKSFASNYDLIEHSVELDIKDEGFGNKIESYLYDNLQSKFEHVKYNIKNNTLDFTFTNTITIDAKLNCEDLEKIADLKEKYNLSLIVEMDTILDMNDSIHSYFEDVFNGFRIGITVYNHNMDVYMNRETSEILKISARLDDSEYIDDGLDHLDRNKGFLSHREIIDIINLIIKDTNVLLKLK